MLNTCFIENTIPRIWRQSKIIAILKPGKDSAIPKNYRPISLLCNAYNLYERLILNRVSPLLEQHLIKEQGGFRPEMSCTIQHNELPKRHDYGCIFCRSVCSLRHSEPYDPHPEALQHNPGQPTMYSLSEHAVQQKILCGTEQ